MYNEWLREFNLAQSIFQAHKIAEVVSVEKIEVGFSNELYTINHIYILKLSKSEDDKENFAREIYFCHLFANCLPVPRIIASDISQTLIEPYFIVYEKIEGDNLYAQWHLYTATQRKALVQQICTWLRKINQTPYAANLMSWEHAPERNWHDRICISITETLDLLADRNILSSALIQTTHEYLAQNHHLLHTEQLALTYFDPHFDNFWCVMPSWWACWTLSVQG